MASMNKPAQNSTSWYTDVTNNWTSIESNLVDKTLLTAKGDLLTASASSTPSRLAIGNDGQVLVADSTQTTGLKWGDDNSIGAVRTAGTRLTTQTSLTNSSFEDLDGMSISVNVSAAQKVLAFFAAPVLINSSGIIFDAVEFQLLRGSTVLRQACSKRYGTSSNPVMIMTLDQPGAGTFTYKVQWKILSGSVRMFQDLEPFTTNADRQLILVALPG